MRESIFISNKNVVKIIAFTEHVVTEKSLYGGLNCLETYSLFWLLMFFLFVLMFFAEAQYLLPVVTKS